MDVDASKTPVAVNRNYMEMEYCLPWAFTATNSKDNPNEWFPYFKDCDGDLVDLDTDCVKFIIECVNRHDRCLDDMMRIYKASVVEDPEAEPMRTIREIAFKYCKDQLVADGYDVGESTAKEDVEAYIEGGHEDDEEEDGKENNAETAAEAADSL